MLRTSKFDIWLNTHHVTHKCECPTSILGPRIRRNKAQGSGLGMALGIHHRTTQHGHWQHYTRNET